MKNILLFLILSFASTLYSQTNPLDQLKKPIPELPKSELTSVGLNPDTIQHLLKIIEDLTPRDFRGLVVIKNNKLVVEEYFNTYWRATIHDIRSAGKSITAMLLGIAIDKGLIKNVEQKVFDFFPKHKLNTPPTPAHLNIKIKHLLMMSSGLDADSDDINSPGNGINWVAETDWIRHILNLPMKFPSGEEWVYNDAAAMLAGAIIEEVSGQNLSEFARENLFDPLGIKDYYWFTNPQNQTAAMGNLYLSTLDFAKLGLLFVNQGKWQNQQIISPEWLDAMTTKRIDISKLNPFASHYGYFWYISEVVIRNHSYTYFFASGMGGNQLIIIPEEHIVIGITSSAYGQGYGHWRAHNTLKFILKAIR